MSLVSVLIPVTMLLVGFGLWAFFWAVRTGQFDDLDIPAWEILVDDKSEAVATDAAPAAAAVATAAPPALDPDDPV
jgi:cbb3-type cytochrome oxidase maturation protein